MMDRREYGSNILVNGSGFSFSVPRIGSPTAVFIPNPPAGETRAAIIHSHPLVTGNNYNSISDKDKETMRLAKVPSYVVTPNGKILIAYVNEKGETRTGTVFTGINYYK